MASVTNASLSTVYPHNLATNQRVLLRESRPIPVIVPIEATANVGNCPKSSSTTVYSYAPIQTMSNNHGGSNTTNNCHSHLMLNGSNARRSAVEILAETKAYYVKSETVRKRTQTLPLLKHRGRMYDNEVNNKNDGHSSNMSCVTASLHRRSTGNGTDIASHSRITPPYINTLKPAVSANKPDLLQNALRKLLNYSSPASSVENVTKQHVEPISPPIEYDSLQSRTKRYSRQHSSHSQPVSITALPLAYMDAEPPVPERQPSLAKSLPDLHLTNNSHERWSLQNGSVATYTTCSNSNKSITSDIFSLNRDSNDELSSNSYLSSHRSEPAPVLHVNKSPKSCHSLKLCNAAKRTAITKHTDDASSEALRRDSGSSTQHSAGYYHNDSALTRVHYPVKNCLVYGAGGGQTMSTDAPPPTAASSSQYVNANQVCQFASQLNQRLCSAPLQHHTSLQASGNQFGGAASGLASDRNPRNSCQESNKMHNSYYDAKKYFEQQASQTKTTGKGASFYCVPNAAMNGMRGEARRADLTADAANAHSIRSHSFSNQKRELNEFYRPVAELRNKFEQMDVHERRHFAAIKCANKMVLPPPANFANQTCISRPNRRHATRDHYAYDEDDGASEQSFHENVVTSASLRRTQNNATTLAPTPPVRVESRGETYVARGKLLKRVDNDVSNDRVVTDSLFDDAQDTALLSPGPGVFKRQKCLRIKHANDNWAKLPRVPATAESRVSDVVQVLERKLNEASACANNGASGGATAIMRSKSDVTDRYYRRYCQVEDSDTAAQIPHLVHFFDHLGHNAQTYESVFERKMKRRSAPPSTVDGEQSTRSSDASATSSPVYFSDVSTIDSTRMLAPSDDVDVDVRRTPIWLSGGGEVKTYDSPSIVEKNARIIKWLCNCRKAQMAALSIP